MKRITLALIILVLLAAPSTAYVVTQDCSKFYGSGWRKDCCCPAPDGTLKASSCTGLPRCALGNLGWTWNTPLRWQVVNPAVGFTYSGSSSIAACGNGLKNSHYWFYLTDRSNGNQRNLGELQWADNIATRTYSFYVVPAKLAGTIPGEYKAWGQAYHQHVQKKQAGANGEFNLYAYENICIGTLDYCPNACVYHGFFWYENAPDGDRCRTCKKDTQLCAERNWTCGSERITDDCGRTRTINCGSCTAPLNCVAHSCTNTECSDSIDNNGNGYIDFTPPAGVRAEPGCVAPDDPDEICNPLSSLPGEGASCPQCNNGLDDDGDGFADYPADKGCNSPDDPSEGDITPPPQVCEPDCTYTSDAICHIQCDGQVGCVMDAACDNAGLGSAVGDGTGARVCCQGLPIPLLDSDTLIYNTDRDRVRATRIIKKTSGESIVMQIINFR